MCSLLPLPSHLSFHSFPFLSALSGRVGALSKKLAWSSKYHLNLPCYIISLARSEGCFSVACVESLAMFCLTELYVWASSGSSCMVQWRVDCKAVSTLRTSYIRFLPCSSVLCMASVYSNRRINHCMYNIRHQLDIGIGTVHIAVFFFDSSLW